MQKKFFEHPNLSLLPFLLFYFALIIIQHNASLFGDEGRYLQFAENLLNGFYSPPPPQINLWNGPGFPLYLLPFTAFNLPNIFIKLFNALLYYAVLLLFHKSLSRFLDARKALLYTMVFGCYYMPYKSLPHILSETFTIFLVALTVLYAFYYFSDGKKSAMHSTGFALLLAYLALTKVIFGEVYVVAFMTFIVLFLATKNILYRRAAFLILGGLLFCLPYLYYTYSLTGRIFYWSNAGGMSMYWMSNPVQYEWGEWHNDSLNSPQLNAESREMLKKNHEADFRLINQYQGVERDDKYKDLAMQNVTSHLVKILINWVANWSRMFFNYPVSYVPFRLSTFGNMLANIPLLILLIYAAVQTWKKKNRLPFALKFLLIITGIYLFGTSTLSAYDRMFYIMIPVFGIWIAYSMSILRTKPLESQKSK